MRCQDFSELYSARIDGRLSEADQMTLQDHWRDCLVCRRTAAGMNRLQRDLGALADQSASSTADPALAARIKAALRQEALRQTKAAERRADLLDWWRIRLMSQGIGAVLSMAMIFIVAVGILKPTSRLLMLAGATTEVLLEETASDGVRLKVLLLQPPPPPVFAPTWDLLGVGANMSENDEMVATVKVGRDGRASISQVVVSPRDPAVVNQLSWAMKQHATFRPHREDQPTSGEAVVIFSKMNISG